MLTATKTQIKPGKLLIGGEWRNSAKTFATINPATGEELTQVAAASAQDVDAAVQSARKTFDDLQGPWRKMSASERGRILWQLAELIEKTTDELADRETP